VVSENGGMEGKVALITGGTSGIGKAAATALAAMGAEVVVSGRDEGRGEAALGEIRDRSGSVNTNLASNNRGLGTLLFRAFKPFMRTPEQGADTAVYLAVSPETGKMTGRYLTDRRVISSYEEPHDVLTQKRLWEVSEELTNLGVPS
jgi:D-arabinose 1-dehydrogenase-like Zn-dependent alcohol dehydrogenase